MKASLRSLLLSITIGWLCIFQVDAIAQQATQSPAAEAPGDAAEPAEPADQPAAPADTEEAATEEPDRSYDFDHDGNGNVILHIGHDSHLPAGQSADAVISVFGSSTSDGRVNEAVVSVFGDTRVTGPAAQGAIAVFGDTYVNSAVGEAAIAVFGNVELGPQAEIDGDVVTIGGTITRDPQAVIHGNIEEVSFGGDFGRMEGLHTWVRHCLLLGRPLAFEPGLGWAWGLALGFLALYVLIALLFGGSVEKCIDTLETQPGQSVIASLLAMLLTPIVFLLLLVTVVGIAVVPFVGMALFCAGLFGKSVILAAVGRRVTGATGIGASSHVAFAALIGGIIVLALYVVPVIGFITYKLTGILGLGVVIYTLLLATRARRANGAGARPATPPGTAAPAFAEPASTINDGSVNEGATPPPAEPAPGTSAGPASESAGPAPGFAGAAPGSTGPDSGASGPASGSAGPASGSAGPAPGSAGPAPGSAGPAPGSAGPASGSAGPASGGAAAASAAPTAATTAALALPRAGFWIRMAALFIDTVLVAIIVSILDAFDGIFLLLLATYGAVMWKLKATTVGGLVCNLRVVRLDGREISWDTAVVRALGCFLSLVFAFLGFFWIAFDEERQSWHDKIAGTVVVRAPRGMPLV